MFEDAYILNKQYIDPILVLIIQVNYLWCVKLVDLVFNFFYHYHGSSICIYFFYLVGPSHRAGDVGIFDDLSC